MIFLWIVENVDYVFKKQNLDNNSKSVVNSTVVKHEHTVLYFGYSLMPDAG